MNQQPDSSEFSRLAETLARAESSTRGEGIDPDADRAYVEVKRQLLAGEISMGDAHELYEQLFFKFEGTEPTQRTDSCD
ncbi:MAG TPA: hypothetical protein VK638_27205 [Edaphobacter sp.]|nr:hypothetical protein [Edaphobacter sp.]